MGAELTRRDAAPPAPEVPAPDGPVCGPALHFPPGEANSDAGNHWAEFCVVG